MDARISGVHAGSHVAEVRNLRPDVPPEINVAVEEVPHFSTRIADARCQTLFDYVDTGRARHMVQFASRPGVRFDFAADALTEFWVRGGALEIDGQSACANSFICCAAGTGAAFASPHGALLIGWAEGPQRGDGNLFGF